jgi:hypothetical protein
VDHEKRYLAVSKAAVCTRPTLSTIEKYALAVGARVEIHVRTRP